MTFSTAIGLLELLTEDIYNNAKALHSVAESAEKETLSRVRNCASEACIALAKLRTQLPKERADLELPFTKLFQTPIA